MTGYLFYNCKIDSTGENVLWHPTIADVTHLSSALVKPTPDATFTWHNESRFMPEEETGSVFVKLSANIDIAKVNYMIISDDSEQAEATGRTYFAFVNGIYREAGEVYEIEYEVDGFHTFAHECSYANAQYEIANDRGIVRNLIYDDDTTNEPYPSVVQKISGDDYYVLALFAFESGGYCLFACQAKLSYGVIQFTSAVTSIHKRKGRVTQIWSVPAGIYNKVKATWSTYNAESLFSVFADDMDNRPSRVKEILDSTGMWMRMGLSGKLDASVICSPTISEINGFDSASTVSQMDTLSFSMSPEYSYFFGTPYSYEPLPFVRLNEDLVINVKYELSATSYKVLIYYNGECKDITKIYEITPTFSEAVMNRIAEKQQLALSALSGAVTGGLVSPTYDTDRVGFKVTSGSDVRNTSANTHIRHNKKGQVTSNISGKGSTVDYGKRTDTFSRTYHKISPVTGVNLGLSLARHAVGSVTDFASYLINSKTHQYGVDNQSDGYFSAYYGLALMKMPKLNANSVNKVINLYGYRINNFFEASPTFNQLVAGYHFRYIKLSELTVTGLQTRWTDMIQERFFNGIRIYRSYSDYLEPINIVPTEVINTPSSTVTGTFIAGSVDSYEVIEDVSDVVTTLKTDRLVQAIIGSGDSGTAEPIQSLMINNHITVLTAEQQTAIENNGRYLTVQYDGYHSLTIWAGNTLLYTYTTSTPSNIAVDLTDVGYVTYVWLTGTNFSFYVPNSMDTIYGTITEYPVSYNNTEIDGESMYVDYDTTQFLEFISDTGIGVAYIENQNGTFDDYPTWQVPPVATVNVTVRTNKRVVTKALDAQVSHQVIIDLESDESISIVNITTEGK